MTKTTRDGDTYGSTGDGGTYGSTGDGDTYGSTGDGATYGSTRDGGTYGSTGGGGLTPGTIQRIEGGFVVVLTGVGTVVVAPGLWWFPLAVFLAFDLSMLGYLRSTAAGAAWYNAVHTYAWPALLAVIALLTADSWSSGSTWLALIAMAWGFHVAVDRLLGYGLKLPDSFNHTHLGRVGQGGGPARPRGS